MDDVKGVDESWEEVLMMVEEELPDDVVKVAEGKIWGLPKRIEAVLDDMLSALPDNYTCRRGDLTKSRQGDYHIRFHIYTRRSKIWI